KSRAAKMTSTSVMSKDPRTAGLVMEVPKRQELVAGRPAAKCNGLPTDHRGADNEDRERPPTAYR
ncbi:hypothetical protein NDU88_002299, partial [Pleurodeles waltl]